MADMTAVPGTKTRADTGTDTGANTGAGYRYPLYNSVRPRTIVVCCGAAWLGNTRRAIPVACNPARPACAETCVQYMLADMRTGCTVAAR